MRMPTKDKTHITFGKISDPGVMHKTPLSLETPELKQFKTQNFQYIVDHIADMFGLLHGTIQVNVNDEDYQPCWIDYNSNNQVDSGEIVMQFTMNASIHPYSRESYYGKYFMYQTAKQYGSPVIFGIAAHEVGHLINLYTLCNMERQLISGKPYLVQTSQVTPYWDELCADYLAGIVLAKAMPRLSQEPLKAFLQYTEADQDHPDGFWRTFAVEMGYQWGCNNSPLLTDRILSDISALRQLMQSFHKSYCTKVYYAMPAHIRQQHSILPQNFTEPVAIVLGTL